MSKENPGDPKSKLSEAKRALLEQRLRNAKAAGPIARTIARRDVHSPAPLSFAQQRMWFINQLKPDDATYNIYGILRLEGPLDPKILERCFQEVITRHEGLRTTFQVIDGQPMQVIHDHMPFSIPVEPLGLQPGEDLEARLIETGKPVLAKSFDLETGPLLRAHMLKIAEDHHGLLFAIHHIVSDGWTQGVLFKEVFERYAAYVTGRTHQAEELPIQYADYAIWQRDWMKSKAFDEQVTFWKEQLGDSLPTLELMTDHPRPPEFTFRGARAAWRIDPEISGRLRTLSREHNATLYIVLASAFNTLMHHYTSQDEIVVGTAIAGRNRAELEGLVGFFVNSLVLRSDVSGNPTFSELIVRAREQMLKIYSNQDVPFEQLVEILQPSRDLNRNPLFQVIFALQNMPLPQIEIVGLSLSPVEVELGRAAFDLDFRLWESRDGLEIRLSYSTDLFDASTIQRLLQHFEQVLGQSTANPDIHICDIELMGEEERGLVLDGWNGVELEYARGAGLAELFEAQAARRPEAPAIEFGAVRMSYGEINAQANRLAHRLRAMGVGLETPVALYMERSAWQITAMLAIIKAGGAYVPLDPSYPADRLGFMLADSGAPVLLTEAALAGNLPPHEAQTLLLEAGWDALQSEPAENLAPSGASGASLAYVIYTSGSTGVPKGVSVVQRGVARLVLNTDYVSLGESDRIAQASNSSFDAATFEIWGALLNGGVIVGFERDVMLSPVDFAAALRERKVSTMFVTTALFNQFAREVPGGLAPLKTVMFGGEASDPASVRRVLAVGPPERLLHVYGPTESTTFATWHHVREVAEDVRTVPIGRPIANTTAYVLDKQGRLVPPGVAGELYVGGDGLAREYLNRAELTAERFVDRDVRGTGVIERLYKTGDVVRWNGRGELEFVGRIDHQVKLRGFRIELGEIEARLLEQPGVAEAVVLVREDEPGDRRLVAYIGAGEAAETLTVAALRAGLKTALPEYMVPGAFVVLERLPLTANGKINRKALPAPEGQRQVEQAYEAPRNELETKIAEIWKQVLKVDRVSIDDNFFDLGGHSLLLIQVNTKIKEELKRSISVVTLFKYPTISSLAAQLSDEPQGSNSNEELRAEITKRLESAGKRQPIAIVGMSGRFPGASNVEKLWENVSNGVESVVTLTEEQLRAEGVSEAALENPNYVRVAAPLEGLDQFDAGFFGFNPREAQLTDPQQRLFIECVWEALENAGYDASSYQGAIGLYAGLRLNDYLAGVMSDTDLVESVGGAQVMYGSFKDFMPTRVSYKLNLRGPSINIQTACSTSLVAVHMACQSLLSGDCKIALAGGSSIKVPHHAGYVYEKGNILSPDGHCRPFDANARGTLGSNGVAVVALKRLEDAIADGDTIHAIIRGTAINNDGSVKIGYTAPSIDGQAEVITMAQAAAEVSPESITYVEAHGTGTELGDPIEIAGLTQAFGVGGTRGQYCGIGSLKSNMGHLDAAAGAAGLIKTVLALRHRQLPPSLHYTAPNPEIDFANSPFYVVDSLRPWDVPANQPRRAGVSSFGIGGTNAHVILEEAPPAAPPEPSAPWQLLVLSARSSAALDNIANQLAAHLEAHEELELADAAWTLQVGRKPHSQRRVVVARDRAAAIAQLRERAGLTGTTEGATPPVAFLFTGQGAQYAGMGEGLFASEPVFRAAIEECCELLKPHLGLDLRTLLYPADDARAAAQAQLKQTRFTQPSLFVTELALARLWMSWGIEPSAMLGHSIGEWVAAHLAGVMDLATALELVATRGRLMDEMPGGAMLAVPLAEAELLPLLAETGAELATINGPAQCVAAGTEDVIERLRTLLAEREVEGKRLETSHAFHSAMMDPAAAALEAAVARVKLAKPMIRFISNVSGTWITDAEATSPAYWGRQLRRAVRFADGLGALAALNSGGTAPTLLEVGPGRVLSNLARTNPAVAERGCAISRSLPSPREEREARDVILEGLGKLWLAGVAPKWAALYGDTPRRRVPLPTYPFERKRYWIAGNAGAKAATRAVGRAADVADWFYVPSWRRSALPAAPPTTSTGAPWLIFNDDAGLGAALGARLRTAGEGVIEVAAGAAFARRDDANYTIDFARRDDYVALLAALGKETALPARIVHLCSYGPPPATLEAAQELGFYSLLWLAQALGEAGWSHPLDLIVATSHLHEVTGDEPLAPARATVLGPCRVIGLELPHVRATAIDLPAEGDTQQAAAVLEAEARAVGNGAGREPVVAYRNGWRWVEAYEPVRLEAPAEPAAKLRKNGLYVITGGLGGVGLAMARWLAETVQARLVLIGRNALPPREEWPAILAAAASAGAVNANDKQNANGNGSAAALANLSPAQTAALAAKIRAVEALETASAQVLTLAADVANLDQMRTAINTASQHFNSAPAAIIHAAGGVKSAHPIETITRNECEQHLRTKTEGLRVLAQLADDIPLDFCLLTSSLSSVLGVAGFAGYTAAHLYMDAFATSKNRDAKMPWIVANWDNWKGDAKGEPTGRAGADYAMPQQQGLDALNRILNSPLKQVVVSTGHLPERIAELELLKKRKEQTAEDAGQLADMDARPELDSDYSAPQSEAEQILVAIWEKLLGIKGIGVHDNFFELGGDSIIGLQITAKANQAGLKIAPKQVFEQQTIAELATVAIRSDAATVEEGPASGQAPLTPIQRWYFEQEMMDRNHFNHAMLLKINQPIEKDHLREAVRALVDQHDALRTAYDPQHGVLDVAEPGLPVEVHLFDLYDCTDQAVRSEIDKHATELQVSMDMTRAPLLRVGLFDLGPERPQRLLLIAHHLIIDAIAWRVVLEDLQMALGQLAKGEKIALQARSTSFKRWAEKLNDYAQTAAPERELDYWTAIGKKDVVPLPIDLSEGPNDKASSDGVVVSLSREQTHALLHDVHKAYNTQIDDLLLAALSGAITQWNQSSSALIDLEGHGRESIVDGVDLSRTVGWFTTMYPVLLEGTASMKPGELIKATKEQLRSIPANGIHYGVLRFLNRKPEISGAMQAIAKPEIVFLYLGQFDQVFSGGLFQQSGESPGPEHNAKNNRHHLLEINCVVLNGQLQSKWAFSKNRHRRETIQAAAESFMEKLGTLIAHCQNPEAGERTASDYQAASLSQRDLEKITKNLRIAKTPRSR